MQRLFALFAALSIAVCLLATPAAASPYPNYDFDNIQHWVGSGTHRAGFVIDSTSVGGSADFWGYRWADGQTPTGADMFFAIAGTTTGDTTRTGADPRLSVDVSDYGTTSPNYFINSITFNGRTVSNDFSGPPYPYWAYYIATATGPWTYSLVDGMSTRTLTDGVWDGWSYAADGIGAAPVPEPTSLIAVAGAVALLRRRRC